VPGRELLFEDFVRRAGDVRSHHWEEQWKFVPPEKMDFVGRLETFERDLALLRERLALEPGPLPERTPQARAPYTAFYDDETRAIVAEGWARDIELFGYAFGEEPAGDVRIGEDAVRVSIAADEAET
jgi:hypothetical protein